VVVLLQEMRGILNDPSARTPPAWNAPADQVDAAELRSAMRAARRIALRYTDPNGMAPERTVWPPVIAVDSTRALIAWCELREDPHLPS
jgi:predicted DNA-binding transcriptional regulator YafY